MIMMLIAGAVYFVQARVSLWTMPDQQKTADENVHLFVTNHDYVYIFQSNGCTSALLGNRWDSTNFPNVPWTEVILQRTRYREFRKSEVDEAKKVKTK